MNHMYAPVAHAAAVEHADGRAPAGGAARRGAGVATGAAGRGVAAAAVGVTAGIGAKGLDGGLSRSAERVRRRRRFMAEAREVDREMRLIPSWTVLLSHIVLHGLNGLI